MWLKKYILKKLNKWLDPKLSELRYDLSKNIKHELDKRALISSCDYVEKYMKNVSSFEDKYDLLTHAMQYMPEKGLICEFGVFEGGTLEHIASKTKKFVYGFDSFEGLPEDWDGNILEGHFALPGTPDLKGVNIKLVKGWFNESIPKFLGNLQEKTPIAFLHIDCDLYSSTKDIFSLLGDLIQDGTVIVFDEYFNYPNWQNHEFLAFKEYTELNKVTYKYIGFCERGEQVAVLIESIDKKQ